MSTTTQTETTMMNLTPHPINLITPEGTTLTLLPQEEPARVGQTLEVISSIKNLPLPVCREVLGEVTGLPEEQPGVTLIVSFLVRAAVPDRGDVLSPGNFVRDEKGRVTGAKSLIRNG